MTRRVIPALVATVALGGCSTHEFRYEGGVPPEPIPAKKRVETAHEIVTTLLDRFAPPGRRLPAAVAAPFAEAALLTARATRSVELAETATRLGTSLLRGRIPVGIGLAYPGSDGRTPDPRVTAEVGRTLLYFDQIRAGRRWRPAATRVAQALVTPRLGWTRVRDGYAVREPDARRRYNIALTAEVGLVLAKLAAVGGGPLADRFAKSAFRTVRKAQISPGRWHKSIGGTPRCPWRSGR